MYVYIYICIYHRVTHHVLQKIPQKQAFVKAPSGMLPDTMAGTLNVLSPPHWLVIYIYSHQLHTTWSTNPNGGGPSRFQHFTDLLFNG